MKLLLSLFLCVSINKVNSQSFLDSIPMEEGSVRYERIFEQPGTKDQLYSKGKICIADIFKNAQKVIQSEDKEEGYITGKGTVLYNYHFSYVKRKEVVTEEQPSAERISFTIKLFFKDNKAKAVISDITLLDPSSLSFLDLKYDQIAIQVAKQYSKGKPDDQAKYLTLLSKYHGIETSIDSLLSQIGTSLSKKAENDF